MNQEQIITEYDAQIHTKDLQMLKELLPFVQSRNQMAVAMLIQMKEFQNTMRYFQENANSLSALSVAPDADRRSALLQVLRKFCTPNERETIDNILNILCVMENYDKEDSLGRFITQ